MIRTRRNPARSEVEAQPGYDEVRVGDEAEESPVVAEKRAASELEAQVLDELDAPCRASERRAGPRVPEAEESQEIGHRPLTDVERLGYFHAQIVMGQAMKIQELSHSWDEIKEENPTQGGYGDRRR